MKITLMQLNGPTYHQSNFQAVFAGTESAIGAAMEQCRKARTPILITSDSPIRVNTVRGDIHQKTFIVLPVYDPGNRDGFRIDVMPTTAGWPL